MASTASNSKNCATGVYQVQDFKRSHPVITDAALKAEIKTQLDEMLSDRYNFAGMNRYFDPTL